MSVGDSAEEFILIHARLIGRERFVCWPVVFRQIRSKLIFLPVGRRSIVSVSVFHAQVGKFIFNRSLVGARHTPPAAV